MKKLFTTLALVTGCCLSAFAQTSLYFDTNVFRSVDSGRTYITPRTDSIPRLLPAEADLPCIKTGEPVSDTFYFKMPSTWSIATINSIKIDSIYLPAGLVWHTSNDTNTFAGGADGVILVTGTTYQSYGTYKLRIIVDIDATVVGYVPKANVEDLMHWRYHMRVNPYSTEPCRELDPADSTLVYSTVTDIPFDTVGISEIQSAISGLSIHPNPLSGAARVAFTSAVSGTYSLRLTDMLGAVVSSREVEIYAGQNELMMDRNGLASGVYLMSIANDKGAITRKVTIE